MKRFILSEEARASLHQYVKDSWKLIAGDSEKAIFVKVGGPEIELRVGAQVIKCADLDDAINQFNEW